MNIIGVTTESNRHEIISKIADKWRKHYGWSLDDRHYWIKSIEWKVRRGYAEFSINEIDELVKNMLRPGAYCTGDGRVVLARHDDVCHPDPLDICAKVFVDLRREPVNSTIESIVIGSSFTQVNNSHGTLCSFAGCGRSDREPLGTTASNAAILLYQLTGIEVTPKDITIPIGALHFDLVYARQEDGTWSASKRLPTRIW